MNFNCMINIMNLGVEGVIQGYKTKKNFVSDL